MSYDASQELLRSQGPGENIAPQHFLEMLAYPSVLLGRESNPFTFWMTDGNRVALLLDKSSTTNVPESWNLPRLLMRPF